MTEQTYEGEQPAIDDLAKEMTDLVFDAHGRGLTTEAMMVAFSKALAAMLFAAMPRHRDDYVTALLAILNRGVRSRVANIYRLHALRDAGEKPENPSVSD